MTVVYFAVLTRGGRVVDVRKSWPEAARSRVRWLEVNRFVPTGHVIVLGYRSLQEAWAARWSDAVGRHGRVA
jgi:hypothetical protein